MQVAACTPSPLLIINHLQRSIIPGWCYCQFLWHLFNKSLSTVSLHKMQATSNNPAVTLVYDYMLTIEIQLFNKYLCMIISYILPMHLIISLQRTSQRTSTLSNVFSKSMKPTSVSRVNTLLFCIICWTVKTSIYERPFRKQFCSSPILYHWLLWSLKFEILE